MYAALPSSESMGTRINVPSLYVMLLEEPGFRTLDYSNMKGYLNKPEETEFGLR